MNQNFWEGFEKQAISMATFKPALDWGKKALTSVGKFTGAGPVYQGAKSMIGMARKGDFVPGKGPGSFLGRAPANANVAGAVRGARQNLASGGKNLARLGAGAALGVAGTKMLSGSPQQQPVVQQTYY